MGMQEFFDKIYVGGRERFFSEMDFAMEHHEKRFVVTANPETFMIAEQTPAFHQVLTEENTLVVPDGIGLVKAANYLNKPIHERITGVELAEHLIDNAGRNERKIYLYGAREEVVSMLAQQIRDRYPKAEVHYQNGYGNNDEAVFQAILAVQPDLILVALGIPRQELAIHDHLAAFHKGIFVGVGGSFDVLSGTKKRAPKFFIRFNLEWLYRILKEPKRIKRFYSSNIRFLSRVKKMKKNMEMQNGD